MSILENMLSTGSGALAKQLGGQFGITPDQATSSISTVLPALAAGMKEKLARGGSAGLSQLLSSGRLTKFADDPAQLSTPAAMEQGKSLLSGIFGSQDMSSVVSTLAEKAGVPSGIITSLLPVCATLLGGYLSKASASGENIADVVGKVADAGHTSIMEKVKAAAAKIVG